MRGPTPGKSRHIRTAIRALVMTIAAVATMRAATWEIGAVPGAFGGEYSSLRFDKYGNGHVSYVGGAKQTLQYGFWDHNLKKWFTTPVDAADGFCSLVIDTKQYPHIAYPLNGKLRYAYWDGAAWRKQTIPVPSKLLAFYTSIALDAHDRPSLSYYEVNGVTGEQVARLRVVTWNGTIWELRTADPTYGSGKFNSIVMDSAGNPHIAYGVVIYENSSLRYSRWDGTRWIHEILEGAGVPGTYRQAVTMLLDKNDVPHIAYSDVNHGIVKYAVKTGNHWQMEAVDQIGRIAYPDRNGLALDEQGTPYISYFDVQNGVLKVAHKVGPKWVAEVIEGGGVGFTSSIQISEREIWVTYSGGATGNLRFARSRLGEDNQEVEGQGHNSAK